MRRAPLLIGLALGALRLPSDAVELAPKLVSRGPERASQGRLRAEVCLGGPQHLIRDGGSRCRALSGSTWGQRSPPRSAVLDLPPARHEAPWLRRFPDSALPTRTRATRFLNLVSQVRFLPGAWIAGVALLEGPRAEITPMGSRSRGDPWIRSGCSGSSCSRSSRWCSSRCWPAGDNGRWHGWPGCAVPPWSP
jgi:hypothetical protein